MGIKTVALAGASGHMGEAILHALLSSNKFQITILKRSISKSTFPAAAKIQDVDFNSVSSLTNALTGQDALISCMPFEAIANQTLLIDAAISANVKRFIPSNFGSDLMNETLRTFPAFHDRVKIQKYLEEKTPRTELTYTTIVNGVVVDYGLRKGAVFTAAKREAKLFDGGEKTVSFTTLATIGKAVVGVLEHPLETANRAVYVQDTATTQKKLLELAQRLTAGETWKVDGVDTAMFKARSDAAIKNGASPNEFLVRIGYIVRACYSGECGALFEHLDNGLLGIEEMSEEEIEVMMAGILAEN
ncbi:hypothetical protein G7Y89_g15580 [Cudoniella acicularis]|uniref:NmrA-like domain-containing protein n=1 Tax=Cudoniella acicularis TaxID=354080 RepID=A0A8H4VLU0_9HELO|nr:hypothetical protein G7Y89_g15580 [Cudoniella acicularis]